MPIEAYKTNHLYRPVKQIPAETLEFFSPKKTENLYLKKMEDVQKVTDIVTSPTIEVPEIVLDLAPTVIEEEDEDFEETDNKPQIVEESVEIKTEFQDVVRIMQMVRFSYYK